MIEVAFKYGTDEEFGGEGWIPVHQPDFSANTIPAGVAHDVLDHHDLRDGSVEGEMRAFGAMLCSRGVTGHITANDYFHRPAEWHLGFGMASVLRDKWSSCDLDLTIPNAGQRPLDDQAEAILDETVRTAIKCLRSEVQLDDHEEDDFESFVVACREALPRYMRIGYRQVQRRFRADGIAIAHLYDRIVNHRTLKAAHPQEEDRLVIRIRPRTLALEVDFQPYDDPYDDGH